MKDKPRLEQRLEQEQEEKPRRDFKIEYLVSSDYREGVEKGTERFLDNYKLVDSKGKELDLEVRAVFRIPPLGYLHTQIMPLGPKKRMTIWPREYYRLIEPGRIVTLDKESMIYHLGDKDGEHELLEILFRKVPIQKPTGDGWIPFDLMTLPEEMRKSLGVKS